MIPMSVHCTQRLLGRGRMGHERVVHQLYGAVGTWQGTSEPIGIHGHIIEGSELAARGGPSLSTLAGYI